MLFEETFMQDAGDGAGAAQAPSEDEEKKDQADGSEASPAPSDEAQA